MFIKNQEDHKTIKKTRKFVKDTCREGEWQRMFIKIGFLVI